MRPLVVWDFNSTILADTQACIASGNHVITTYGGKAVPRNRYIATFSFPSIDFYSQQGVSRKALEKPGALDVFHEFYEPRAAKCRTRKGARSVLFWLKNKGIDSVILSNHVESAIRKQLERLGLDDYITRILANTDTRATHKGNSKIEIMRDYFTNDDYSPTLSLIVGDSPEDISIGKELGLVTVGITGGYFSTSRLKAANPDYLITRLDQIIPIVKEGLLSRK